MEHNPLYNLRHKFLFIKKILYTFIPLCCFFVCSTINAGYQDLLGYKANKDDIQYVQQETIRLRLLYATSPQTVLDEQTKLKNELFDLPAANTTKVKQRVFRLKRLIDEMYLMSAKDNNERLVREGELLMEGQDFIGAYQLYESSDKTQWNDAIWMHGYLQSALLSKKRDEVYKKYETEIEKVIERNPSYNINLLFNDKQRTTFDIDSVDMNLLSTGSKMIRLRYLMKDIATQDELKDFIKYEKDNIESIRHYKGGDYINKKDQAIFLSKFYLYYDSLNLQKEAAQLYPTHATYQSLGVISLHLSCDDVDKRRSKSKIMILDKKYFKVFNTVTNNVKDYCKKFDKKETNKQLNKYYKRYNSL